ncbi:MAG: outer membrane protein assembly factor BamE [Opitutaceae bacterium]
MKTHTAAMRAKIFTLHVLLLLAGCSSVPSLLYKIDIQQGNVITHEMLEKIKPGMTRAQVRFVLGSPVISDAFHGNRWDYVYRLEQEGRLIEQHRITAFFEDDRLTHTEGRLRPSLATNSSKAAVAKPIEERPKPVAAPRPARAAPKKIAPPSVPVDPMEVDRPKEERDLFGAREADQPKEKKGMIDMMLGK